MPDHSIEWSPEPKPLPIEIATATEHVELLLSRDNGTRTATEPKGEPIINARDCELAGFDLALVLEAARMYAR